MLFGPKSGLWRLVLVCVLCGTCAVHGVGFFSVVHMAEFPSFVGSRSMTMGVDFVSSLRRCRYLTRCRVCAESKCSPSFGCGVRSTSTTSSSPLPSTAPGPRGTLTSTTARGKRPVLGRDHHFELGWTYSPSGVVLESRVKTQKSKELRVGRRGWFESPSSEIQAKHNVVRHPLTSVLLIIRHLP